MQLPDTLLTSSNPTRFSRDSAAETNRSTSARRLAGWSRYLPFESNPAPRINPKNQRATRSGNAGRKNLGYGPASANKVSQTRQVAIA
jgi:hypothetical protein